MLHVILSTIRHQKWRSWLMILSSGLIVLTVCLLGGLIQHQEEKLAALIRDTKIPCIVTDSRGTNSEDLGMLSFYVDMLTGRRHERGCYLDEVVTDVRALAIQSLDTPEQHVLQRILSLDSDPSIKGQVQFFAGWDEAILRTEADVCLVPVQLLEKNPARSLTISAESGQKTLRVIGVVSGGSSIYVPFYFKWDDSLSSAFQVRSCSFTIRDNTRLEESKEAIYNWFSRPSVSNGAEAEPFGVLVRDQVYLQSLEKLEGSLELLRLLLPLLAVLGGVISFLGTFAMTRGRRKEFGVMRCLGMKTSRIFALVLSEQSILLLTGTGLGLCIGSLAGASIRAAGVFGVLLLHLLGTAAAAGSITRINVMELMKTED